MDVAPRPTQGGRERLEANNFSQQHKILVAVETSGHVNPLKSLGKFSPQVPRHKSLPATSQPHFIAVDLTKYEDPVKESVLVKACSCENI